MSPADHTLIVRAMNLAADSELFSDSEFQTLFGVERDSVRKVAANWPNVDMKADVVRCSVLNSLNNLRGYPHGEDSRIEQQLGVELTALGGLYARAAALMEDRQGDSGYFARMR
jgi:hypothetical protein